MIHSQFEWWEWTLGALVTILLGAMGYIVYDLTTAETFKLRKGEWACTRSHTSHTLQMVGKVPIMMPHTVCDQWERKA